MENIENMEKGARRMREAISMFYTFSTAKISTPLQLYTAKKQERREWFDVENGREAAAILVFGIMFA